jgi:hypothetical protein
MLIFHQKDGKQKEMSLRRGALRIVGPIIQLGASRRKYYSWYLRGARIFMSVRWKKVPCFCFLNYNAGETNVKAQLSSAYVI